MQLNFFESLLTGPFRYWEDLPRVLIQLRSSFYVSDSHKRGFPEQAVAFSTQGDALKTQLKPGLGCYSNWNLVN